MSTAKYEYKSKRDTCEWEDHAVSIAAHVANEEQESGWELVTFTIGADKGYRALRKDRYDVFMVFRRLRAES